MESEELRETAVSINWWLDAANSQARRELSKRNEPLAQWLEKIESLLQQKLKEVEKEAMKA
jgi:hypothetical protein